MIELSIPDLKLSQLEECANNLSEMARELQLGNTVEVFANETVIKATTLKVKELRRKQISRIAFMKKIKVRDKLIDEIYQHYENKITEVKKECSDNTGYYIEED
jgi:hypothetical protein